MSEWERTMFIHAKTYKYYELIVKDNNGFIHFRWHVWRVASVPMIWASNSGFRPETVLGHQEAQCWLESCRCYFHNSLGRSCRERGSIPWNGIVILMKLLPLAAPNVVILMKLSVQTMVKIPLRWQNFCFIVSLQLTWRSGTKTWNLQAPNGQMSCSHLTKWEGNHFVVPVMALETHVRPINRLF